MAKGGPGPLPEPTEWTMRKQMFRTMQAAESAFKAITEHLTADKMSAPEIERPDDYSSVRVQCSRCEGQIQFTDYQRDFNSPEDTCGCGEGLHIHKLPPPVRDAFLAHWERLRTKVANGDKCDHQRTQRQCKICALWLDTEIIPPAPLNDLKEVHKKLDEHAKALSIIGVFGGFENVGFSQTEPGRMVRSLVGFSVCRECVGTGWLARDESCTNCKGGYIKP